MTKVHYVKKALKNHEGTCVKKGMAYFWWAFPPKGKRTLSLTKPKRSQITKSEYDSTLYAVEEFVDAIDMTDNKDTIRRALEDAANEVEFLKGDTQCKLDNMNKAFPNSCPTGLLLGSRVESCETLITELRDAAFNIGQWSTAEDIKIFLRQIGWNHGG